MKSRPLQHILFYPIILLVIIVPLIFSKDLISVFTMPKLLLTRVLTALMLVLIGIWFFRKKPFPIWKTKINALTILYAIWLVIATISSTAFVISLLGIEGRYIGLITMLNFLLIFLVSMNVFSEEEYAIWAMYGMIFTGTTASIYGILQFCYATFANTLSYVPFFNGDVPLFLSIASEKFSDIQAKLTIGQITNTKVAFVTFYGVLILLAAMVWSLTKLVKSKKQKIWISILGLSATLIMLSFSRFNTLEIWTQAPEFRVFSTMGHANHFGALIAACALMSILAIFITQKKALKKLFILTTILLLTTIIFTASRGAVIGLITGSFSGLIVLMIKKRKFITKHIKKITITAVMALILFSGATALFWNKLSTLPIIYRTQNTINFMLAGNVPDRISWWFSSAEMIKDHPITGIGVETFRNNFNKYRRTDYKLPTNDQYLITPESTHFEWLNIAVTQGIPGVILYSLLIISVLWLIIKAILRSENKNTTLIIAGFFMSAMTYIGQVLISFGIVPTILYFYLSLGIATALSLKVLNAKRSELSAKPTLATIACITAAGMLYLAIIHYQAHYWYSQALMQEGRGDGNKAIEYYQKSIEKVSLYYPSYEGLAELYLKVTQNYGDVKTLEALLKNAEFNYLKGIELSPQMPHVHGNLAQVYSKFVHISEIKKDQMAKKTYLEKMKEAAEKSIEFGINNPIFPYNYANLLASHNEHFDAVKYFDVARGIDANYEQLDFKVAQSYFELKNYSAAAEYAQKARAKEPENLDIRALQTKIQEAMEVKS